LETIKKILRIVDDFPTLPTIFSRLLDLMSDPNSTVADVSHIISSDQASAVKIIRTVNSSVFGLQKKINSISEAIFYLGFNEVKYVTPEDDPAATPVRHDGGPGVVPAEPYVVSVLARATALGPTAHYTCRVYADDAAEFTEFFSSAASPKVNFLHRTGFRRAGARLAVAANTGGMIGSHAGTTDAAFIGIHVLEAG